MKHPRLDVGVRRERLLAQARGRTLDLAHEPRWMTRDDLPLHSYDTVVSVFQLCSVSDVFSTLLRIKELMTERGQLLVLEHVRATGWRGRVQDAAAPVWRRVAGGCRPHRDVVDLLRQHGFAVTDCDRFQVRGATPLVGPAVSAVAIRRIRHEQGAKA